MKPRTVFSILLACLLSSGCRQDAYLNKYIETLHGDIRALEDHVNVLEYEKTILEDRLQERDPEPDAPRPPRPETPRPAEPPVDEPPVRPDVPPEVRPDVPPEFDLTPPRIEEGIPVDPDAIPLPSLRQSRAGFEPAGRRERPPEKMPRDRTVVDLALNPFLTGRQISAAQPGDDRLLVVVEPRNAADEYVPRAAAMSVVVLDPQQQGDAARIARWDLSPQDVSEGLRSPAADRGIALLLPWPEGPPRNERLHLFVRYLGESGDPIEVDQQFHVKRANRFSHRWTPRTPLQPDKAISLARDRDPPVQADSTPAGRPVWSPFR